MAKRANRVAVLARLGYEVKREALSALSTPAKKNKYGAKRVGEHASKKEHNRANQLKLWQRAGLISNLREQVPFELIPAQYGDFLCQREQCRACPDIAECSQKRGKAKCGTDLKGKPVRVCIEKSCKYIADFVYTDNETGQTVVEDTKGVQTKEYIIKRKLMLYLHGIRIKEV